MARKKQNRHSTQSGTASVQKKQSLTVGHALLQNIRDNPHNDTLGLRFADWLEKDWNQDSANFIRIQIALVEMKEDNPAYRPLKFHEGQLLLEHRKSWLGPFYNMKTLQCTFQRGLLKVTVDGADFLDDDVQALADDAVWQWVSNFDIERVVEAWSPTNLDSRLLPEVTKLTIATEEALRAFSGSHALTRLQHLIVEETDLTGSGIEALAAAPFLNQLTSLELSYHDKRINKMDLAVLLAGLKFARLDCLKLQSTKLMDDSVKALACCPHLANLKHLDLSHNNIRDPGAKALAQSPYLAHIERLILDENCLGPMVLNELRLRFGAQLTCVKREHG